MQCQLPKDHTRFGYLLDALESQHPPLLAAMANIEEDNVIAGKRNDYEIAVAYILLKEPVLKQQSNDNNKRVEAQISDTNGTGFGSNNGIGTSSVHLYWHANPEYKKLSQDQKKSLWKWRKEH